ncbi:MAG: RNA polymerase sigma factor [Candidatus Cyclobacteriaceae bacterium M3_2C_046]
MDKNYIYDKLWDDFLSGDRESFALIYQQYISVLFNYGKQIEVNAEIVEDAIQDLFIELWQRRENLKHVISIKAYLLKSLRYKLLADKKKRFRDHYFFDNSLFPLEFSCESKMINQEMNSEILNCIKANVNRLTNQQREVIFHIIYHNLSYEETANIMELSKKTIYNLFSSAINSLRSNIKKEFPRQIQLAQLILLLMVSLF